MSTSASGQTPISRRWFGAPGRTFVRLSVVIATFNRLDTLLPLLGHLGEQDFADAFEVVVVDDGGSVDVEAALNGGAYGFSLLLLRRANGGPGPARDTGVREASGEIVVILDDDMTIGPDFLSAHAHAHDLGAEVVLGNIVAPVEVALPLFEKFHIQGIERSSAAFAAGRAPRGTNLCTGNVSFRRDDYLSVGGFDLSLRRCEDRDLGVRLDLAGKRFVFCAAARSEHRTDHVDVGTWRRRSGLFGELDQRIADKHPSLRDVSPWAFFPDLPVAIHPVLLVSAIVPSVGGWAAAVAYRCGEALQRVGRNAPALQLASTTYALEYYGGVGRELRRRSGWTAVVRDFAKHRRRPVDSSLPGADR